MRIPLKLTILSAALLLVAAAVAYGATTGTYRGTTSQGLKASVSVKNDAIQLVNVPFVANSCNKGDGYSITARRFLYSAPITRSGKVFKAAGKLTIKTKGGKAVVTRSLRGKLSAKRATGVQKLTLKAKDKFGRHTCTSRVTFKLKLGA
jgi:hypothetical protein